MGYNYVIVCGRDIAELEEVVNLHLQDGKRCQGGPFLAQHPVPEECGEKLWWWQAMVRD